MSTHSRARTALPLALGAQASADLALDLVRILAGTSAIEPDPRDQRFADPAWNANPAYRRLGQSYLAACAAGDQVVEGLQAAGARRAAEQARLLHALTSSALAPTNTLPGNPAAVRRAFETGGLSLLRGAQHALDDLRRNHGLPATVPHDTLRPGRDLAITPGEVVQRDEVAELLRYHPTTEQVRERPLLIVPPMINRYYFIDLRPGRSFAEYAVAQGLQTHLLSWRNPTTEHRDWSIRTYVDRVASAIDQIKADTGADDVNVIGFCAGGILSALLLARDQAQGESSINAAAFAVTMLDFGDPMPLTSFAGDAVLGLSRRLADLRGLRTAAANTAAFTWLRPQDLVWNYWVNNYLMGQRPPEFDILSWNADGTNLTAGLYADFVDLMQRNPLREPGYDRLGVPIDLAEVRVPTFVAGAVNDHLTPWRTTYRTTQMLGGESVFALSSQGHIASLVNPPGNPRATYRLAPTTPGESPEHWQERAQQHTGSWWEAWAEWALLHSGGLRTAPRPSAGLGSAPGRYVHEQARTRVRRPADEEPGVHLSRGGLAYSVIGSGPPLLWISGFNAPSSMLGPMVERLAERFTCLTFDLRGCGRTERAPTTLTTRRMAEDVVDVLDSAGLDAAHLIGFSLGGMVAQEVALTHPERVRSLVLAATTPGGLDSQTAAPGIEMGVEFVRMAHRLDTWFVDPLVSFTQAWAGGTHDAVSRLPSLQVPTLVIHGEHDRLLKVSNAERLAELIPDATLVRLPDVGHLFFLDSDAGIEAIARWLEQHRDVTAPIGAVPAPIEETLARRTQLYPAERVVRAFAHRAGQVAALLPKLPG